MSLTRWSFLLHWWKKVMINSGTSVDKATGKNSCMQSLGIMLFDVCKAGMFCGDELPDLLLVSWETNVRLWKCVVNNVFFALVIKWSWRLRTGIKDVGTACVFHRCRSDAKTMFLAGAEMPSVLVSARGGRNEEDIQVGFYKKLHHQVHFYCIFKIYSQLCEVLNV